MDPIIKERSFILFCPGVEYLFWAGGVYLAWELSRTYRVVLIADHNFENLEAIRRLIVLGVLHDFVPFKPAQGTLLGIGKAFLRHLHFKSLAKRLFDEYRFSAVIQHTDLEPSNIYLFKKARSQNILCLMYRPSAIARDYHDEYVVLKNLVINRLRSTMNSSREFASALFYLRRCFSYYFNYWLVPMMLTGRIFKPRIDPTFRAKKFFNNNPGYFDFALAYSEREKKTAEANGEPGSVVRNPLYTVGDEANEYLFEGARQENQILILPTSGEIEHLTKNDPSARIDAVAHYASKWAEAIKIIQSKFPGFETRIKYHPMGFEDNLFGRVIKILSDAGLGINVIDSRESAEKLMLSARVIVGSVTSCLWWASELRDARVVISLDLWGIAIGDKYSDVDGIHYFRDLGGLSAHDFAAPCCHGKYGSNVPTLTDFVKQRIEAQPR